MVIIINRCPNRSTTPLPSVLRRRRFGKRTTNKNRLTIKKSKLTYNKKGAKNLVKPRVSRNSRDEEVMADSKYLELAKNFSLIYRANRRDKALAI